MTIDLRRGDRHRYPTVIPQGNCVVCGHIGPVETMRPVRNRLADRTTLMYGQLMCLDREACLARAERGFVHLVIEGGESWATGGICLITFDDPRKAHAHAAALQAAYVRLRIHTDYREG